MEIQTQTRTSSSALTTRTAATTDRFGVPLKGWGLAPESPDDGDCSVKVECENCGDDFYTEDPETDTICAACLMPPAGLAALRAMIPAPVAQEWATCDKCGFYPLRGTATRCAPCTQFYARIDTRWTATLAAARQREQECEPIAA